MALSLERGRSIEIVSLSATIDYATTINSKVNTKKSPFIISSTSNPTNSLLFQHNCHKTDANFITKLIAGRKPKTKKSNIFSINFFYTNTNSLGNLLRKSLDVAFHLLLRYNNTIIMIKINKTRQNKTMKRNILYLILKVNSVATVFQWLFVSSVADMSMIG